MTTPRLIAARKRERKVLLPETCEIQTDLNAATSDDAGGTVAANWSTVATVDCEVFATDAREATVADKLGEVGDYEIWLPIEQTVTAAQRIRHTNDAAVTTSYGIVGVQANTTFALVQRAFAQVVTP